MDLRSLWFRGLAAVCYRRMILVECYLDNPPPDPGEEANEIQSELQDSEWREYLRFDREVNADELQRRRQAGHVCLIIRRDGVLVCAHWSVLGPGSAYIAYLDTTIPLGTAERYVYGALTAPSLRAQGLATRSWQRSLRWAWDADFRHSVSAVLPESRSSLAVGARVGYRQTALIGYCKLGPWRREFRRALPRA
ncbi:MAG: hypothetical protein E6J14_10690 [Chloroflexi bacterium]|nr:MAG: hypothetical protein E6J14_10690 [Chloroflexota bacterium]